MLVLSRNIGTSIIIDGGIKVTILDINGDQAKIGVEAPRNVTVDREEIHLKKQAAEA